MSSAGHPPVALSAASRPLHAHLPLWGKVKARLRNAFFRLLRKVADTDDARAIQVSSLRDVLPGRPESRLGGLRDLGAQPYDDLGTAPEAPRTADRDDIILISARFRSGSTLLWNLFRALKGCTAYYEPFNERRWFDPAARGSHTDPTHRGVDDYWREYEGLTKLGPYYRQDWIGQNLLMDENSWDPAMKRYVEVLVEGAPGRPVLQFNRIDFRLPWFRHQFPRAKLLHLYRHPRDQWMSSLVDPAKFPRDGTMAEFAGHDHYYLRLWACDLKYHFPFLDEAGITHPYQTFYYLWKLSYLYGRRYAHLSLCYEDLLRDPQSRLADLLRQLNLPCDDLGGLAKLVGKPRSGRWRAYASEDWFRSQESRCESVLADFLRGVASRDCGQERADA
ncbi:MAG: sulfotransferase [Gemmataceae bacterium]|nr:sulfotransferase [Gemmataceae bacterium]